MRKIPKANYLTADEIEQLVKHREADVAGIPEGAQRQAILKEIAQLRMYATTKRLLGSRGSKRRGS